VLSACVLTTRALCGGHTQELLHKRLTASHAPGGRESKGSSGWSTSGVALPLVVLPAYVDGAFRALPHLCNAIKEVPLFPLPPLPPSPSFPPSLPSLPPLPTFLSCMHMDCQGLPLDTVEVAIRCCRGRKQ